MKAVIFDSPEQPLRLGTATTPRPAADEVRIRINACGICGSDLHMAEDPAVFGLTPGAVLGHEFAGEVVEVGGNVRTLTLGDRVAVAPIRGCGHCLACERGEPAWCPEMTLIGGGYAEEVCIAARQCRRLPDDVATEDGALAEPTAVALHAVMRAGIVPGQRVLVLGAGPIGLLVAFWARRLGAASVVVADLNRHQEARSRALGATGFAISDDGLADWLVENTGSLPEIVFECVGKPGLMDRSVALVRPRGTVVGVGLCVGGDNWDAFAALHKEVTIRMSAFFDMHEFEVALDALRDGPFRPQALVTDRIGLAEVPTGFDSLKRRTTQCKVVIQPARP